VIALEHLVKEYPTRQGSVRVLDDIDLSVQEGEILAVVGPSGAGKSTLAGCINLLERPTSGRVRVNGRDLSSLKERELRVARRGIGTIFQSDGLQGRRTAAENVALPLRYLGLTERARKRRVAELLDRVGLAHRADYYPHQLSGGQRQRVGIARALALRPTVLLSDEATSGLDPETTRSIVGLIKELRADLNLSVLFITHEMETVIEVADTVARIEAGRIAEYGRLAELLLDPASQVGSALISADTGTAELRPDPGHELWRVSYRAQGIRTDWIAVVGAEIGAPLGVLEADVRVVHGARAGYVVLQVEADRAPAFAESVRRHGLLPELVSAAPGGPDPAPVGANDEALETELIEARA
jgi:ABC-type methionine transport system ATPase subunit